MKLKYSLTTVEIGDEVISVPVGENADELHAVFKLNSEGRFIVELLENDITEDQIVEKILAQFDTPEDKVRSFVHNYIVQLSEIGLIED